MLVEVVVQVGDDFNLLLDDLGEDPVLDCEQARHPRASVLYLGLYAHPKRYSCDDLQHDAAEAPDVDDPRILVPLHLLEHFLVVLELVLEEYVVEYLWWHVLGSGHGELFEVGEEEAAAEVDELDAADVADVPDVVLALGPEEDVLGLEVGVHDVVAVDQVQRLAHLHHQDPQLVLLRLHPLDQLLVHYLHHAASTR